MLALTEEDSCLDMIGELVRDEHSEKSFQMWSAENNILVGLVLHNSRRNLAFHSFFFIQSLSRA